MNLRVAYFLLLVAIELTTLQVLQSVLRSSSSTPLSIYARLHVNFLSPRSHYLIHAKRILVQVIAFPYVSSLNTISRGPVSDIYIQFHVRTEWL